MKKPAFFNLRIVSKKLRCPAKVLLLCPLFVFYIVFSRTLDAKAEQNPFLQTVLVYYVTKITKEDVPKLAKYDVLALNRFNYRDVDGATWSSIKEINPNIEIYLYQQGAESNESSDEQWALYLNNISRYKNSRNHSKGALYTHHPNLFLLDSDGNRIYDPASNKRWKFDHGNTVFHDYWLEATISDIAIQPWAADGVFVDGVAAYNPYGKVSQKYPTMDLWNPAMNDFVRSITKGLHAQNQKVFANRCASQKQTGYDAWIALDSSDHPPDIVMEEGAFVVEFGPSDAQFFGEPDWKRQVDIVTNLVKSRVALISHTTLSIANPSGIDNYGKPVTFWQALWYAMCSYHLAKRDDPNNAYFMFGTRAAYASTNKWYKEYDRIDLGKAKGPYSIITKDNTRVYFREFEKGYVFVNPTARDAKGVTLPAAGIRLTHENITGDYTQLPQVSTIDVLAHHGEIVFVPPANTDLMAPSQLKVIQR
jgi:hypothetical protein